MELKHFHTNGKGQRYYVSSDGRIFKEVGYTDCSQGYRRASGIPGYRKHARIHQIVAEAFLGPCPEGKQINHKNGDRNDNRVDNLEYVTPRENVIDGWKRGRIPLHGETNGAAKLTEEDVKEIKRLLAAKGGKRRGPSVTSIAKAFNVSPSLISAIWNNQVWRKATTA